MDFKNIHAASTLPVDTIALCGKCRFSFLTKPTMDSKGNTIPAPFTFKYRTGNISTLEIVVPATNYPITATYCHLNAKLSIKFEFAKLVYTDNSQLVTLEQAKEAIKMLSHLTGLPLATFELSRLDITQDFAFKPSSFNSLKRHLQAPKHYQKERGNFDDSNNFCFYSKLRANTNRSDKYLLFYNKHSKTRMESRLFSAPNIKRTLGASLNLKLEDVLTPAFTVRAKEYLEELIWQITSKNRNPILTGFRNAALAGLEVPALY